MTADFITVRKGKGRIHLTVSIVPGRPVETLCDKQFDSADLTTVDVAADCQACVRRQSDPGRVSSAFFEGGRGSALLEISLEQARERRLGASERRAETDEADSPVPQAPPLRRSRRQPPHLTIVPSDRPEKVPRVEAPARTPVESPPRPAPEAVPLPRGTYRTPAGVLLRVGGKHERPRVERRQGDRVRIVAGDVELDVPSGG